MKKNKCLLISFILRLLYSVYIISYVANGVGNSSGAEQLGASIATAIVIPHMIVTVLATIFNALGYFLNKRCFALTGAVLYDIAMILFPAYFFFVIIQMIFKNAQSKYGHKSINNN